MTVYPAAISLLAIQRLRCPKCRTRMMLAHISPGPRAFELRTFDCSKCLHVEQIVIASDPRKSGVIGWSAANYGRQAMPPPDTAAKPRSKTMDRALSLIAAFLVVAIIIVARP
jgi:hypothetical protein